MSRPEVLINNYVYELSIVEIISRMNSELTGCINVKGLMMIKVLVTMWLIVRNEENKACCN